MLFDYLVCKHRLAHFVPTQFKNIEDTLDFGVALFGNLLAALKHWNVLLKLDLSTLKRLLRLLWL